jgi:hypothetical protein
MSQQPEIKFNLSRNWLFGGYAAELTIKKNISTTTLSEITERILFNLKEKLATHGEFKELKDIKGREPHEESLLNSVLKPSGEELLLVAGQIATESRDGDFNWEPFQVACHTEFNRFEDPRSIVHSAKVSGSTILPDWLPWWLLGTVAPLKLEHLRLGLELFTSRFVLTRLSLTPTVSETILIEADQKNIAIKLRTERPYWKPCNPFRDIRLLRGLSDCLGDLLGVSLEESFSREIREFF